MSGFDPGARAQASRAFANGIATQRRLDWWARGWTRLHDVPVMAVPPTVTLGTTTTSSVNPAVVNGANIPVPATDARLSYAGLNGLPVFASGRLTPQGPSNTSGVKSLSAAAWRVRFASDAPAIDFAMFEGQNTQVNAIVDGQWVARGSGLPFGAASGGTTRYQRFDFGSNTVTHTMALPFGIVAGGTGYATGDIVSVGGGTFTRAARLRIASASGGVAGAIVVEDGGSYSIVPTATPFATTAVTGAGTGMTFGGGFWSPVHATRRMRTWEFIVQSPSAAFAFMGPVTTSDDIVAPARYNPRTPRLLVVGDSQNAGTYLGYGGGNHAVTVAWRLGMRDGVTVNALGSTGWVTTAGASGAFSHASRIADYLAAEPDVILFDGSQNDGSSGIGVAAAVTATLNTLLAGLPAVRIVLVGPVVGAAAPYMAALAAGVAACVDVGRVRLIDNLAEGWAMSAQTYASSVPYRTNDSAHLGQYALDEVRSRVVADRVASAVLEMVG